MPRLIVFNSISLDGYFTGKNGDLSWAHNDADDTEWEEFVQNNASGGGALVFGRVTYEMMVQFWPTPGAAEQMPVVAEGMNSKQKLVFSRTLTSSSWQNTRFLRGDLVEEVRRLKSENGPDLVILGSGSIVAQLAPHGLIDEYQVVVLPLALGGGRTMFEGIDKPLQLRQTSARTFANGNVFVCYEPR